jgi:hypothetical protein
MLKRLAALTVSVLLPLSPLSSVAQDGVDTLSAIYGAQYSNRPATYTPFYPPTDGLMQDVKRVCAKSGVVTWTDGQVGTHLGHARPGRGRHQ